MFNEMDILAKLQNGENIDDIAAMFADALNKAKDAYEAEQAELQMKRKNKEKIDWLQSIIDDYVEWYNQYYGVSEEFDHATANAEDVIGLIDSIAELGAMFGIDKKPAAPVEKKAERPKSQNVLDEFLKSMGW